jgi:hypothetical protein
MDTFRCVFDDYDPLQSEQIIYVIYIERERYPSSK